MEGQRIEGFWPVKQTLCDVVSGESKGRGVLICEVSTVCLLLVGGQKAEEFWSVKQAPCVFLWVCVVFFCFFCQCARQKASELEDYQSLSVAGTQLEGDDEPAIKKRKMAKEVSFLVFLLCFFQTEGHGLTITQTASANQNITNDNQQERLKSWTASANQNITNDNPQERLESQSKHHKW